MNNIHLPELEILNYLENNTEKEWVRRIFPAHSDVI
jgi:hypothetical protein